MFQEIPTATLRWEGLEEYNDGLTRIKEYEVKLQHLNSSTIKIGEEALNHTQAQHLHGDLTSLRALKHASRGGHPFSVELQPQLSLNTEIELPWWLNQEVEEWLGYALGHQTWDPDVTEW